MLGKRSSQENDECQPNTPDKHSMKRIKPSTTVSPSKPFLTPPGKLVIVEGNIGVGKTTLSQKLSSLLGYKLFLEPTSRNPYLEKFYAEPKKYALKLQLWIFQQRLHMYIQAVNHIYETGQGVLLDRSVFSDKVFADVGYADKNITPEGYGFYMYIRTRALKFLPVPHVTLYLDTEPEVCRERILARGRSCEQGIPVSYLQSLHDAYQEFNGEMDAMGSMVHRLDWSHFGEPMQIQKVIEKAIKVTWSELVKTDFSEFCSSSLATLEQYLNKRLQTSKDKENIGPDMAKLQEDEFKAFEKENAALREKDCATAPSGERTLNPK